MFNNTTLEMNLLIYKALKRVHLISWLMTPELKYLNITNWEAKSRCGVGDKSMPCKTGVAGSIPGLFIKTTFD